MGWPDTTTAAVGVTSSPASPRKKPPSAEITTATARTTRETSSVRSFSASAAIKSFMTVVPSG
jgi:hypothetical protein